MALSPLKPSTLPFTKPFFSLFFRLLSSSSSSVHFPHPNPNPNFNPTTPNPSSPWLHHWDPPPPPENPKPSPPGPIERIVHRLQTLAQELDDDGGAQSPQNRDDLLQRSWIRPDQPAESSRGGECESREVEIGKKKKMRVRGPTMAELTIEGEELRRLRRLGMALREKISVPKAGVTQAVLEKIHDGWGKGELVRLKFHEDLAGDMKTAHEIVERRTGGLVIWRAGSVMVVYRGSNYKQPYTSKILGVETSSVNLLHKADTLSELDDNYAYALSITPERTNPFQTNLQYKESMTEEEEKCNRLLDGLGPRFVDWWGTGLLPVDADLLPQSIPGYKTPLRLLPTGMRSRLTNAEMTNLRKLAKKLPCHFALGRNRHHQGLAAAILKLWEKSLVVKIAVKQGLQNTNNKLMAEELKKLTGGILLLRNKFYIVIYRGKDFVPTVVASSLVERKGLAKDIQEFKEKAHRSILDESCIDKDGGHALGGSLAEYQEAQAWWGRKLTSDDSQKKFREEASRSESARLFKRTDYKLSISQAKKSSAERLLSKIEESISPVNMVDDQEKITDKERYLFRKIGLQMKLYLPLGIRGYCYGVIENMHLHWKHRDLVKLISKQKLPSFVENTARLLEYESGGILVAIERVPKGFALIYYRGKNYERPLCLRPTNILNKAKAFRSLMAMQRDEALHQHIRELERTSKQTKSELGYSEMKEINVSIWPQLRIQ